MTTSQYTAREPWHALRLLLDVSPIGWFVYEPDGRLGYANQAFARMTGAVPLIGEATVVPLVAPESRGALARTYERVRFGSSPELHAFVVPVVVADVVRLHRLSLVGVDSEYSCARTVIGHLRPMQEHQSSPPAGNDADRLARLEQALAHVLVEIDALLAHDDATENPLMGALSRRQQEILELLVEGERPQAIAMRLHLSQHTVRNHEKAIFRKLGVHSQPELITRWRDPERGPDA